MLKRLLAADENKIDESTETEPNREATDHKTNELKDAITLLRAESNDRAEGSFLGRFITLDNPFHITNSLYLFLKYKKNTNFSSLKDFRDLKRHWSV